MNPACWESPGVQSSQAAATIDNPQVPEPCTWSQGLSGFGGQREGL